MARIRTIKPEFFRHELLQELEKDNPGVYPMLLFAGLFGQCDKQGVFEWRPKILALDIVPFLWKGSIGESLGKTLELLEENKLIVRLRHGGKEYGYIPTYKEHQRITGKEAQEPARFPQVSEMTPVSAGEKPEKPPGSAGEDEREEPGKQLGNNGETVGITGREGKGKEGNNVSVGGGSAEDSRARPVPPLDDEVIEMEVKRIEQLHLQTCGLNTLPPLGIVREILRSGKPPEVIDDVYQAHGGDVQRYRQRNIVERLQEIRDGQERSPPAGGRRARAALSGAERRQEATVAAAREFAGGDDDGSG